MKPPLYTKKIILASEECSKDKLDKYFLALSNYFSLASENDLYIDKDNFEIKVDNRFLSPPTRSFNGRTPKESEMFPFDMRIKMFVHDGLKIEITISYFWTIIVYLLAIVGTFALCSFATKGNINEAFINLFRFYFPFISLYLVGLAILKTVSFIKVFSTIYKKTNCS